MMTLYSGTTDPFSQRCRIVLHEKGMDFQIIDVDLDHKPEDLAGMNPYNQVPVLCRCWSSETWSCTNRTSSTHTSTSVSLTRS